MQSTKPHEVSCEFVDNYSKLSRYVGNYLRKGSEHYSWRIGAFRMPVVNPICNSLRHLCALCVSAVSLSNKSIHRRHTENAEENLKPGRCS